MTSQLCGKHKNSRNDCCQRLIRSTERFIVFDHHLSGFSLSVVLEQARIFETDISQHHPCSCGRREAASLEGELSSDRLREGGDGMAVGVPEGSCLS